MQPGGRDEHQDERRAREFRIPQGAHCTRAGRGSQLDAAHHSEHAGTTDLVPAGVDTSNLVAFKPNGLAAVTAIAMLQGSLKGP